MQFLRRRTISRRAFLRGASAAVALPWLDAMAPALPGADGFAAPFRAVFIYVPNGKHMPAWTPTRKGRGYDLPPSLEPLEAVRKRVSPITGLVLDGARSHGDGPGDHARSTAAFLTGTHPLKTGGADLRAGVSVDQLIARQVGQATRFPSLELGLERGRRAGSCDSGYGCAYSNNISWRTESTPNAKETDPREVFIRLFGDPDDVRDEALKKLRRARRRSVLDAVLDDAGRLRRKLGRRDRAKLDDYLTAVRELEKRLARVETGPKVEVPGSLSGGGERMDAMYDVMSLAIQGDATRVITFMVGNAGSNRSHPDLGVADGHHDTSHHGKKSENYEKLKLIDRYHVAGLARFLENLAATEDGDGDLLRSTAVLYGSGISDGNRHDHANLPILLAGEGGGSLKPGRHVVARNDTPLADLHLTLLRASGARAESFADSRGRLKGV